jgi:tRNA(adenine34) deaminase
LFNLPIPLRFAFVIGVSTIKMQTDIDFMKIALDEAQEAYRCGEVPVGAVLVFEGNVLARTHNSPITRNDPSAHAEMMALRQAGEKIGNYRLARAQLYVTLEPCVMCAGAIVHARLARVIFGARDPKCGAVGSLYNILTDERLNHQVEITEGILREECGEILSRFFQQKRIKADSND